MDTPELGTSIDVIRDSIIKIRGVMYADIATKRGEITEIHVVADLERGAKQISRDVESLLYAQHGIRIDHKLISVALVEGRPQEAPAKPAGGRRVLLDGFSLNVHREKIECSVTLTDENGAHEGHAADIEGTNARSRAMANATLDAVHKYLNNSGVFSLIDCKHVSVHDSMATLVSVFCSSGELLVGTALLRDDPHKSAVRATLAAVNRKISQYR